MSDVPVVWSRRADVVWRRSLDAVVLQPVGADEPVVLPGTAAVIWDLLAEPATLDEVVATLAEVYGADPAAIVADVTPLLDRLEAMGAVGRA